MENELKKEILPPYLSVFKLSKLVELVSSRKLNEVTTAYLLNYKFSKPDAYLAVAVLKFLKLIDNDGKTNNDIIQKFQLRGEQRTQEIEKIIKDAYSKLFDVTDKPQDLSIDDLTNEFIHTYKITPRVADSAVRSFLWFCELANLKEKTIKIKKERTEKAKNKVVEQKKKSNEINIAKIFSPESLIFDFDHGIRLSIPKKNKIDQVIAQGGLKSIADEINKFIGKYLKMQNEQGDEEDQKY